MKRILIVIAVLMLLSEGTGVFLLNRFKVERRGLAAPLGFAAILGVLQTLYYIPISLNLSFAWIIGISLAVLAVSLVMTLWSIKDVIRSLRSIDTLIVLGAAAVFFVVFSRMYVDLDYADSTTYLNYIALNINAPAINMYDLSTGLRGQEWNVYYLFQGYYHFGSFVCWLVNAPHFVLGSSSYVSNLVVSVWGLGLLYNMCTNALIVSAVKSMRSTNRIFRIVVLIFALFYANFFYWDIAFAFYGNTFRGLFILLLLYIIMRWQRDGTDQIKWLLWFPLAAGFACSSSFLFMSFAVMFSLAGYLFARKRPHALYDMIWLILPMVCYVLAFLSRVSPKAGILLAVLYVGLLVYLALRPQNRILALGEDFFAKYGKQIFFILVPVLFAAGSFVIHLIEKSDFTSYSYYFWDFRHLDMMTDYLFIHSEWLDGLVNVLRWAGVILIILAKPESIGDDERWMRAFTIMMLVYFLNPLCMILLQKTITGMVFYRNFMTLFNPLTEIFFLDLISRKIEKKKYAVPVLCGFLIFATILGNVGSFMLDQTTGIYWVYIRGGKSVDGIYKIDPDERQAILVLKEETDTITDRQPVLISQSSATLTYIPEAYQIFGPWHYHYPLDRVNEEFYQIARKQEDWLEEEDPDYTKSCGYLKEYDVDYVLLQYWQSPEFDEATEGCTVSLYTGSKYKVKKVQR